ncbi:MAG TPA: hypothetical protein VFU86_11455 [Terriglobales bacterium]|nr:hypothetical protein [Terriglobales bacterium]
MDRLRRGNSVVAFAAITVMTLLLAACPQGRTISQIQADPARYQNKEVAIRGTVVSSWGALGTGMYQVDDGTGRIWVMSERFGVPGKGARVGVAGTVVPTMSLGGRSFATVLRETQRRKN